MKPPSKEKCLEWAHKHPDISQAMCHDIVSDLVIQALIHRAYKEGAEAMREEAAKLCLKERDALEQNREVWNSNPMFEPTEEYIADWESSACRGEEYADAIRNLKVEEA